jgi:hypothetical protein
MDGGREKAQGMQALFDAYKIDFFNYKRQDRSPLNSSGMFRTPTGRDGKLL